MRAQRGRHLRTGVVYLRLPDVRFARSDRLWSHKLRLRGLAERAVYKESARRHSRVRDPLARDTQAAGGRSVGDTLLPFRRRIALAIAKRYNTTTGAISALNPSIVEAVSVSASGKGQSAEAVGNATGAHVIMIPAGRGPVTGII